MCSPDRLSHLYFSSLVDENIKEFNPPWKKKATIKILIYFYTNRNYEC